MLGRQLRLPLTPSESTTLTPTLSRQREREVGAEGSWLPLPLAGEGWGEGGAPASGERRRCSSRTHANPLQSIPSIVRQHHESAKLRAIDNVAHAQSTQRGNQMSRLRALILFVVLACRHGGLFHVRGHDRCPGGCRQVPRDARVRSIHANLDGSSAEMKKHAAQKDMVALFSHPYTTSWVRTDRPNSNTGKSITTPQAPTSRSPTRRPMPLAMPTSSFLFLMQGETPVLAGYKIDSPLLK